MPVVTVIATLQDISLSEFVLTQIFAAALFTVHWRLTVDPFVRRMREDILQHRYVMFIRNTCTYHLLTKQISPLTTAREETDRNVLLKNVNSHWHYTVFMADEWTVSAGHRWNSRYGSTNGPQHSTEYRCFNDKSVTGENRSTRIKACTSATFSVDWSKIKRGIPRWQAGE
jgi:hypothetical protein